MNWKLMNHCGVEQQQFIGLITRRSRVQFPFPLPIVLCVLLSGCSLIAPTNETRLTEYEVGGVYGMLNGGGKGVRVIGEGNIDGCLRYHMATAEYSSAACANLPPTVTTTTIITEPAK